MRIDINDGVSLHMTRQELEEITRSIEACVDYARPMGVPRPSPQQTVPAMRLLDHLHGALRKTEAPR